MQATYSIGNEIYASKDLILGWCFWSHGNNPMPINFHTKEQVKTLLKLYSSGLYPEELREALKEYLNGGTDAEHTCVVEQSLQESLDTIPENPDSLAVLDRINKTGYAGAVPDQDQSDDFSKVLPNLLGQEEPVCAYVQQPNPHDTSVEKSVHQKALSRLAIYYLMVYNGGDAVSSRRMRSLLLDNAIKLELRTKGPDGRFMALCYCPVLAHRPEDKDIAELVEMFIPFVQ